MWEIIKENSHENFWEDNGVIFNEAKIIYKSQLKLQNLIRELIQIVTRKNNF